LHRLLLENLHRQPRQPGPARLCHGLHTGSRVWPVPCPATRTQRVTEGI
jgi:hypothetical protein